MRTASVAVLVCAALGATTFSLQAAALRPTPPVNAAAARAADWLLQFRYVTSTIRADGRTLYGSCYHGRYAVHHDHLAAGSVLLLSNGGFARFVSSKRIVGFGAFTQSRENAMLIAGCTGVLGPRIEAFAQFDTNLHMRRLRLKGGLRVVGIRFHKLTLLLDPKTDRPVGIMLGHFTSRIELGPIAAADAHFLAQQ